MAKQYGIKHDAPMALQSNGMIFPKGTTIFLPSKSFAEACVNDFNSVSYAGWKMEVVEEGEDDPVIAEDDDLVIGDDEDA